MTSLRRCASAVMLVSSLVLVAACGGDPTWRGQGQGGGSSTASGGEAGCRIVLPELLAEDEPTPTAIVADETHVYWLRHGGRQLVREPVGGGPVEVFVDEVEGYDLAIDDLNVYAAVDGDGPVAFPKAGGEPTSLKLIGSNGFFAQTRGIATFDGKVAWVSDGSLFLRQDGLTTQLAARVTNPKGYRNVAMDASGVYDGTAGVVRRFGFDGALLRAPSIVPSTSLRLSSAMVVVAEGGWEDEGISLMPKEGGALTRVITGENQRSDGVVAIPVHAIDVATDGDELYVLTTFGVQRGVVGGDSLHALQLTDTYSEITVAGENNAIAINSTHVFWSAMGANGDAHNGQINRIARCP